MFLADTISCLYTSGSPADPPKERDRCHAHSALTAIGPLRPDEKKGNN